jgi:hypothetical protein
MENRMNLPALVLLLVLILVSGSAQAETIHACVEQNGTLKIRSGPGQCRPNQTPIQWNSEGAQGPAGEAGPEGPAGTAGEDGLDGPAHVLTYPNGEILGDLITYHGGTAYTFYSDELSLLVTTSGPGHIASTGETVLFENDDCTGAAYLSNGGQVSMSQLYGIGFKEDAAGNRIGPPRFFRLTPMLGTNVPVRSRTPLAPSTQHQKCEPHTLTLSQVQAWEEVFPPFPVPIPQPFEVEVSGRTRTPEVAAVPPVGQVEVIN